MPRIDVPFVIEGQTIKQTPVVELTAGGKNYFYATFAFDGLWDDIENPKATFSRLNEKAYIVPLTPTDNGYECEIPWEVMRTNGMFSVGVFGGDRLNTDVVFVKVICGCEEAGEEPRAPTVDWFCKVDKQVKEIEKTAEEAVANSENAADNCEKAVTRCEEAASAAKSVEEKANNGEFDGKTAYQYAVDGGYIGSEEDFTREVAFLATARKSAEQSAASAAKSAEDAESAMRYATIAADDAKQAVDDATTQAQNAEKSAQDASNCVSEVLNYAGDAHTFSQQAKESADDASKAAESILEETEKAKKYANNVFANALKGHKTGQAISADDVSPIEHELDIKITGENVEGTKVTRLGKNFANLAGLPETKKYKAVTDTISGYRIDDDGNIIITSCSTNIASLPYVGTNIKLSELCPEARVGMTMRLRVIDSYSEGASKGNVCIYLDKAATVWAFTETAKAITITQNMLDSNVVFYASYTPNAVRILSNFQIELGENATEYEPYREPVEATADEDGNVEGLMSLAPNMTVFGENGTVIDCAYNRDINKAFEEITQAMISMGANI